MGLEFPVWAWGVAGLGNVGEVSGAPAGLAGSPECVLLGLDQVAHALAGGLVLTRRGPFVALVADVSVFAWVGQQG